ncbi:MAG: 4-hydroxy-tetrahydrodipicolinate synthase [Paludibacteraceae bacterium]|nr:4-hydroxy-tetrahydrodipicolinate synthase [Paludibacteraceae bacterium]MBQ6985317.1 4-hydroxy-tetrahydrodipicolinate synthase [Paludibacteraceae bacterium]
MKGERLKGLGTALITPFKENFEVDYEALDRVLDTQIAGKVDYIVVLGTTGEAATLLAEEKKKVRRHIVEYVNGRIPLVLGLGGNNTLAVYGELMKMEEELKRDYAAILSVCPYYNKPNQAGLEMHFHIIAQTSPIPVILYNVPGRTGVNLLPETVMRIWEAHPDKILGIKEASGNVEQIKHLIDLSQESRGACEHSGKCQEKLLVISGDDGIACEVMQAGGAGLISVASNAFPEDFYDIVHKKDQALQARYAEMIRLLFAEGNPVGIKAVLAQKGIIGNYLRLPLVPASQELQAKIAAIL